MAEIFLIEYKGHRREYCANTYHHKLRRDGAVITETENGENLGYVLHRWSKEKPPRQKGTPRKILRRATEEELKKHEGLVPREIAARAEARVVAKRLGLSMKLSDVEIQFDGAKMTFFYTADGRVDFRTLVKELAGHFHTWIEMRQISPREESRRIGDCGMCGGEVCCRRANMKNIQIATQDARDQDLQMNMSKLTGLCGKLRCCLCFEKKQYLDVKKLFPGKGTRVETPVGRGVIERVDALAEEAIVRLEDGIRHRVGPDQLRRIQRNSESGPSEHSGDSGKDSNKDRNTESSQETEKEIAPLQD
jgi:cell fate regulator YaaT (PSP1 superfamily)